MGMFDFLFKKKPPSNLTSLKLMSGYNPIFTSFSGNIYDSDVVRSVIDSIASNGAKFEPKHIREVENKVYHTNSNLNKLFNNRPNRLENWYDFLYKIITQREENNNSLIYIFTDDFGNPLEFYSLNYSSAEFLETDSGNLFVKYTFLNGSIVYLPYDKIIHLRKHFNKSDVFGESNITPLNPTLELINTTDQGIINAVKSSAHLRGILKYTGIIKPDDIKKDRDRFVREYLSVDNNGGIGAIDSKADFIPTEVKPEVIDADQMKLIEQKVYKYFRVNENIVQSKYNEDEWNAFYESVLEPIAIQLSQEFTTKLFTDKERGHGNKIIFESNRLAYASMKTKVQLAKEMRDYFTINEIRKIFNMPPREDGDKRLVSLNYVQEDKQNKYQLGEEDLNEGNSDDNI